jgi:TonB family protein
MRRRPEPRASNHLLALAAAVGVHLLVVPEVLRFIVHPPHHKMAAKPAEDTATPGQDASVSATFLTESELEKLLGPTPPAMAAPQPPEAPAPPTEPPAPPSKAPDERPDGQIVSIPPPPREEIPDRADKVSEFNSKTDHEQVSALNGVPQPDMSKGNVPVVSAGDDKNGNTTDPNTATKEKPEPARAQAARKIPGTGDATDDPSKDRGLPLPAQKAQPGRAAPESPTVDDPFGTAARAEPSEGDQTAKPEIIAGGAGPLGGNPGPRDFRSLLPTIGPQDLARQEGNVDDLDDIDKGNGTFLNTRAYKHAWFYNRLKEEIYEHWNVVGAYRRHDPYGRVYGVRDRITVLRIELKLDGSLQDVYVLRNSGAAFLDDVALQAVREAQPFPNPPRGIADDDGIIRITYRFTLDIESGGFKLF